MPGLHGFIRLRPGDRPAAQIVATMMQRVPREKDHVETGFDAGQTSVRLLCFTNKDCGLGRWQDHVALLDGHILDRGAIVSRLRAFGMEAEDGWADASLLAALHAAAGATAMADVDGDFNLCLVHRETGALSLLSSRHGTRHLYYAVTSEGVAFSPHLAGLVSLLSPAIDPQAVQEMFNFGYIAGDRSMMQGAKLLPGASALNVDVGGWTLDRYWEVEYANALTGADSFDDLVDEAGAALQAAVDRHLERFSGVVVPISGGLDSRAILAFASKRQAHLPAYHCSWYAGEAEIAHQLTEAAGASWHEYDPLTFDFAQILEQGARLTEGNVHCHQFWFQPLAREIGAAPETDIILDGYLLDVFFGDTFLVLPEATSYGEQERRNIINGLWRRCRPAFVRRVFLPGFYDQYEQANHDSLTQQMGLLEEEDLSNFIHKFSFANRSNRYSVALPNAQRHFVDYGYPGLSRRLVDLYLRIPPSYKVGAAFSRAVLNRFTPEAARVPWAKTGRPLDRNKTWSQRLAEGLSLRQVGSLALLRATGGRWDVSHHADLNRHFRRHEPFRRAHLAIADDERTFARGMIDPAGLRRLTGMIDAGWPVFFLLQSLVTVELFHRRFVD
ncbi:MAG TPA: hypothetical protein DIC52_08440 [Candidatus Latescibacteria bacterium]|nr:hypothetical protein [Candidatus Latescibacterota bacterium]